jgi:hypothetical protein
MKRLLMPLAVMLTLCIVLAGCAPEGEELEVSEIPWSASEATSYVIQTHDGTELGSANISISQDADIYTLTCHQIVGQTTDDIVMVVDAENLKPVSETRTLSIPPGGQIPEGIWEITANYSAGKLVIEADTPQGHQGPAEAKLPQDAYANDELLFLLFRALPFAEGYVAHFSNVVIWPNVQIPKCTISVIGKENVETPAGAFGAWKLEWNIAGGKQYFWYAVEKPNYLVKYDNGYTICLLQEIVG